MLSLTVCLILLLNQVIASSPCKSDYSVASMCQTSEARGSGVTLDISTAAATNHTSCVCTVTSNVTGFIVEFENNPNTTNCGVQLDLLFEDKSMQLKCGIPAGGQSTTGKTAQIQYTRNADAESIDSNYCLSFHANRLDVDFTLSCVIQGGTTTLTKAQTSSMVPSTSSSSVQTSSNNTTLAPSLPSSASQTFVSTKEMQTSTFLPTDGTSTVFESSNFTVTSTLPNESPTISSTISPVSTDSVLTEETTSFVSTSVTASSTTSVDTTTLKSSASTKESFVSIETAGNNTKTTTTQQVNVTTTTDTPILNTTESTVNTTDMLTRQGYENLTLVNETSTLISSTISVSSNTSSASYNTSQSTVNLSIENETSTGSSNTSSLNTIFTVPFYKSATTQPEGHNTTVSYSSNNTTDYNATTREYTVATDMYENSTSLVNTTIPTAYNTTTESSIIITNNHTTQTTAMTDDTTSSNTTQTHNGTNFTSTETYSNITVVKNMTDSENTTAISQVTKGTNFTTTERYNETLDNSTTDTNVSTTATRDTTTRGFWEPPIQNYDVPSRSNNIILILVPVAGILLLVFIAVVVYIMCKRSKKASRRTRVPNAKDKADRNGNIERRGNMMEPNTKSDITEKPQKPVDMFVTQSNGKYPAKYKTETEKSDKDKTDLLDSRHGDTLFKEQLNTTLDGSTLTGTGKPMAYEPSEREKDLLDHLELSAIVIENDPNDPNRYFRKSDPGDWYRVIMKGKKPRDSKESRDKIEGKSKKKSKSSGSENEACESKHRRKKHRKRKHRQHSELGLSDSKRKAESRHSSSDSFDKTLSDNDNEIRTSKAASQTRYISSEPSHQQMSASTNSNKHHRPRQVVNKPANAQETKPEHVKTRVIVSKPSGVNMPTQITNNSSDDVVMKTRSKQSGQLGEDKHLNKDSSTSSASNGSELSTVSDRNTPLRSSQTRNSLFGSKKIVQNNKEVEADNKPVVKRPDIVPPLNLTETGDRVGRLDDGFEEFVLSEC